MLHLLIAMIEDQKIKLDFFLLFKTLIFLV